MPAPAWVLLNKICIPFSRSLYTIFQLVEEYNEKIYEHPNFVWLDKTAIEEVLKRRRPGSCDPMVVYNNLLRW